jgi:sugar lactone lactonase YvrE
MNRLARIAATATVAALGLSLVLASPAAAAPSTSTANLFPTTIALPDGWGPEGIAIGPGPFAYFGSRITGSIFRANLVNGSGSVISQGPGTPSLGLKTDLRGRLFVSGGTGGNARVIDTRTGAVLASYQFATGPSFVNDVILTPDAAWFTDSTNPVLYKLPFGRGGRLPPANGFVTVPLTGAIVFGTGTNSNGIVRTPDGRGLIIVQSNTGLLFRVDPRTGVTSTVDLGGATVPNGDGLLLIGRTLFVVQNRDNLVAVVTLNRSGSAGTVVERVTDPRLDVPATVAAFGNRLYLPNARFTTPATPTTTYTAVAIRRP